MAASNDVREAVAIKSRIIANAERRSACWRDRDVRQAAILTEQLDKDWAAFRVARARALSERTPQPIDNPVDRFLSERCRLDEHTVTPVRCVHDAYGAWALNQGDEHITAMRLTRELKRRGIEPGRTKSQRLYRGLALVTASPQMPIAA